MQSMESLWAELSAGLARRRAFDEAHRDCSEEVRRQAKKEILLHTLRRKFGTVPEGFEKALHAFADFGLLDAVIDVASNSTSFEKFQQAARYFTGL